MTQQGDTNQGGVTISMGAARPQTVIEFWQGVLSDFPDLVHDLQMLRMAIDAIGTDSSGMRILTAVACSLLNLQFERTSTLFMADENGEFCGVDYSDEPKARGILLGVLPR